MAEKYVGVPEETLGVDEIQLFFPGDYREFPEIFHLVVLTGDGALPFQDKIRVNSVQSVRLAQDAC